MKRFNFKGRKIICLLLASSIATQSLATFSWPQLINLFAKKPAAQKLSAMKKLNNAVFSKKTLFGLGSVALIGIAALIFWNKFGKKPSVVPPVVDPQGPDGQDGKSVVIQDTLIDAAIKNAINNSLVIANAIKSQNKTEALAKELVAPELGDHKFSLDIEQAEKDQAETERQEQAEKEQEERERREIRETFSKISEAVEGKEFAPLEEEREKQVKEEERENEKKIREAIEREEEFVIKNKNEDEEEDEEVKEVKEYLAEHYDEFTGKHWGDDNNSNKTVEQAQKRFAVISFYPKGTPISVANGSEKIMNLGVQIGSPKLGFNVNESSKIGLNPTQDCSFSEDFTEEIAKERKNLVFWKEACNGKDASKRYKFIDKERLSELVSKNDTVILGLRSTEGCSPVVVDNNGQKISKKDGFITRLSSAAIDTVQRGVNKVRNMYSNIENFGSIKAQERSDYEVLLVGNSFTDQEFESLMLEMKKIIVFYDSIAGKKNEDLKLEDLLSVYGLCKNFVEKYSQKDSKTESMIFHKIGYILDKMEIKVEEERIEEEGKNSLLSLLKNNQNVYDLLGVQSKGRVKKMKNNKDAWDFNIDKKLNEKRQALRPSDVEIKYIDEAARILKKQVLVKLYDLAQKAKDKLEKDMELKEWEVGAVIGKDATVYPAVEVELEDN